MLERERRQFGRRWSRVHGWICVDGRQRIAGTITNFSEQGARLEFSGDEQPLPRHFRLIIDAVDFDVGCEVRHQSEGSIGVMFVGKDIVKFQAMMRSAEHARQMLAELT